MGPPFFIFFPPSTFSSSRTMLDGLLFFFESCFHPADGSRNGDVPRPLLLSVLMIFFFDSFDPSHPPGCRFFASAGTGPSFLAWGTFSGRVSLFGGRPPPPPPLLRRPPFHPSGKSSFYVAVSPHGILFLLGDQATVGAERVRGPPCQSCVPLFPTQKRDGLPLPARPPTQVRGGVWLLFSFLQKTDVAKARW